MTSHDAPIPRKKGRNHIKKPKSDKDTVVPREKERIYRIDRLNLDDTAVEL